MKKTNISFSMNDYEWLRKRAYDQHLSISQVLRDMLAEYRGNAALNALDAHTEVDHENGL